MYAKPFNLVLTDCFPSSCEPSTSLENHNVLRYVTFTCARCQRVIYLVCSISYVSLIYGLQLDVAWPTSVKRLAYSDLGGIIFVFWFVEKAATNFLHSGWGDLHHRDTWQQRLMTSWWGGVCVCVWATTHHDFNFQKPSVISVLAFGLQF